jgi:hypothetical protein
LESNGYNLLAKKRKVNGQMSTRVSLPQLPVVPEAVSNKVFTFVSIKWRGVLFLLSVVAI